MDRSSTQRSHSVLRLAAADPIGEARASSLVPVLATLIPRAGGLALSAAIALGLSACAPGPSAAEALQTNADKKFEEEEYKPKKIERPSTEPPPPTAAELKAWDRKDPEGEKHLYKWDKANLAKMEKYWKELQCFREKVKEEGQAAFGAEPLSPTEERWTGFKQGFILFVNGWQQRLFAAEPHILEKSKFIGNILEAHELVMNGYPGAYNESDELELKKQDARWLVVEDKVYNYAEQLGGKWERPDLSDPKQKEKHDKFCVEALTPPKPVKERKAGKKTPI